MSLKVHGFARHAHTIQTNALGMSSKLIAFFDQTQGVGYMSRPVVGTPIRSVVYAEARAAGGSGGAEAEHGDVIAAAS